MHKIYLVDFFEGMNNKLFFVLIIFVQVIFIFQGLDFADSGFDAVFYSRIFSDPSTVQYNFMFWFTGIIGGAWLKLFPGLGLLGLRLAGIFLNTVTLWITYELLKKYLHIAPLRLSLILIVLFLSTSIREINYDDVSALFFVCAASLLFSAVTKGKPYLLILAGAFISMNTFSRIPNIMGLSLILAILFSGYLNHKTARQIFIQSFLFIIGFALMSVLLIWLMRAMHHDVIFVNSLKLVSQMGGNQENPYGLYSLLKESLVSYGEAILVAIVILVVIGSSSAAWKRLKAEIPASIPYLPFIKYLILAILTAVFIYRAKRDPDFWLYLFYFYAGTSLIVGFLIIIGRQPNNLRILTAIGCIMLLVVPMGSGYVLLTVGKYSIWIIVPITIDYLLNIHTLNSRVVVSENSQHVYEQLIDTHEIAGLQNACVYLTLVFILSVSYFYPYFDRGNRAGMLFPVNNERLHGIYTTESRARVINEMLAASALYAKRDDYVLAYDCIPMYHYLTDTRPYMHNSWPWLYNNALFKEELHKSMQETHICPVVIMQKRSTIGNNWPENHDENYKFKTEAMACMVGFLETYHYRQVWENDFFKIYIPAIKTPAPAEK